MREISYVNIQRNKGLSTIDSLFLDSMRYIWWRWWWHGIKLKGGEGRCGYVCVKWGVCEVGCR